MPDSLSLTRPTCADEKGWALELAEAHGFAWDPDEETLQVSEEDLYHFMRLLGYRRECSDCKAKPGIQQELPRG